MNLIIDHCARSQTAAANAGYPFHSELAIPAGFSFFGACRLGYRLGYSLCSIQMARSPMTDLDYVLTYRFQPKLRIESNYAVYLTGGNAYVFCYALDCYWRNITVGILNLLKGWNHSSRLNIMLMGYGVNYGKTKFFSVFCFSSHTISFCFISVPLIHHRFKQ